MNIELSQYSEWSGSQDGLVALVGELSPLLIPGDQPITKRTLIYYRGKGVISPANGKKYGYLHLAQCLAARKLISHGWTVSQLAQLIANVDEWTLTQVAYGEIEADAAIGLSASPAAQDLKPNELNDKAFNVTPDLPLPELAVQMLAIGVCDSFNRVIDEHKIVNGNDIPFNLKRAMGLLGRLCIEEGKEDSFASIHDTLTLCKLPFNDASWALSAFKDAHFELGSVNLIDQDHRCPTQDCVELASGGNEANIKEQFSFELLTQLCSGFGTQKHRVYTSVRRFIGEKPVTTGREIAAHAKKHSMAKIEQFLSREVYSPIGSHILIDERLYLCPKCGAPIRKVEEKLGKCTIKQCPDYGKHIPLIDGRKPEADSLVLKPHLLSFWFGPSIDELAVYELARKLLPETEIQLYPESDACDISIDGYDIGIDVKSYSSPYLLANALNRTIGRLNRYTKKIIAVSDTSISRHRDYLATLKRYYNNEIPIEFMSVSSVKNMIRSER
ncbi:hypothetical protein NBRC116494_16260 [Aurantivibrio plasticivorans]